MRSDPQSPHDRINLSGELAHMKGFGDAVIRTGVKSIDPILDPAPGGCDNPNTGKLRPYLGTSFKPARPW
jgi:hypothetical protein